MHVPRFEIGGGDVLPLVRAEVPFAAVMAAIILINPFGAVAAVWTFVAISLIAEAIVEIITIAL